MFLLALAAVLMAGDNELTDLEKKDGWRLLFDGSTLAGWRGYRKDGVPDGWKVVEGTITRMERAGDLLTVEQFGDFELSLQWRVAPRGNSGIMYRVTEEEKAPYLTGPEYQVLDNAGHPDGAHALTSAASLYGLYAPSKDTSLPAGEWNCARIIAHGPRIEHWLNGEQVVACEIGSDDWTQRITQSKWKEAPRYAQSPRGHIVLQDHGDKVQYRTLKIRPLK